jgi:hypothetical protein
MEKSTKIILGVLLVGGIYWYWLKKKGTPISTMPNDKKTDSAPPPTSDGTTNTYPKGATLSSNKTGNAPTGQVVQLKEGDAIKGIPETVYILKNGEKHPVTGTWWVYNYGENWDNIIQLSNTTVDLIPTGATFTINGQ